MTAWTVVPLSGKPSEYRRSPEGIAHVRRPAWVRRSAAAARAGTLRPSERVGNLPVADRLEGLADALRDHCPPVWPSVADLQNPRKNKA